MKIRLQIISFFISCYFKISSGSPLSTVLSGAAFIFILRSIICLLICISLVSLHVIPLSELHSVSMTTMALGFRVTSHWFLSLTWVSLHGTTRQQHILPYKRVLFVRDVRVYFVCFMCLSCYSGAARECYGGLSYDGRMDDITSIEACEMFDYFKKLYVD